MKNDVDIRLFKKLEFFDLDVCFSLNRELLVIQGRSGSGKTTILDCIAGIKSPDRGEVRIGDKCLFSTESKVKKPIRDRELGYVFQNYALFPNMTVERNMQFGIEKKSREDLDYVEHIMKSFKIEHLKGRYPNEISGGEKQRVALGRALSTRPKLLLLDEPFSALDTDTKDHVYEEFLRFKKDWDISIIMITHNDEEAKLLGDRTIHIRNGVLYRKEEVSKRDERRGGFS